MGWKQRAHKRIAKGRHRLLELSLEEIVRQSATVAEDLSLLLSSCGMGSVGLRLDLPSLEVAETRYRTVVADPAQVEAAGFDLAVFERLLAIFLGGVIAALRGAQWVVYRGPYHVLNSVVVQLPSGRHVDVFGVCSGLSEKKSLSGAAHAQALVRFVQSLDEVSFP